MKFKEQIGVQRFCKILNKNHNVKKIVIEPQSSSKNPKKPYGSLKKSIPLIPLSSCTSLDKPNENFCLKKLTIMKHQNSH